jgi:hypothetical protein
VFHIFGALAEFERNLIKERPRARVCKRLGPGAEGGRPKRLNAQQRALAVDLFRQKDRETPPNYEMGKNCYPCCRIKMSPMFPVAQWCLSGLFVILTST